jgi:hypothetical protein
MSRPVALALLAAFAACAGGHPSRAGPDAELRTEDINLPEAVGAATLTIARVDGEPVPDGTFVLLAPGRHSIGFEYKRCPPVGVAECGTGWRDRLSMRIEVLGAHRYVATARPFGRRIMVSVTEVATGERTVAFTRPDTR